MVIIKLRLLWYVLLGLTLGYVVRMWARCFREAIDRFLCKNVGVLFGGYASPIKKLSLAFLP
jgi:hypothetical protein